MLTRSSVWVNIVLNPTQEIQRMEVILYFYYNGPYFLHNYKLKHSVNLLLSFISCCYNIMKGSIDGAILCHWNSCFPCVRFCGNVLSVVLEFCMRASESQRELFRNNLNLLWQYASSYGERYMCFVLTKQMTIFISVQRVWILNHIHMKFKQAKNYSLLLSYMKQ